ncbi:MAG: hypothetical protein J7518_14500 [Nocardioidaceae bacterium]|nr:hypothetical protein [Nocardioidaceae bacterium]
MNLDQTLTDELRTVATELRTPPPPPAAELVRLAERQRTRARLRAAGIAVVAAAAVVTALALGGQLGKPDAAPSPAPRPTDLPTALPTGDPPAIPFIENDRLHVAGRVQPGSWVAVQTREGSSVAYLDDANDLTQTIALFDDGDPLGRFTDVSTQVVVLSPHGARAAWVERDGSRWFLVVYDFQTHREQGRLAVDARTMGHVGVENEGWESLGSVDDTGTVRWGGVLQGHVWTPDGEPQDTAPDADAGTPSGRFPVDEGVVSLSPDGAWGAWTVDRTGDRPQGTTDTPDQYDVEVAAQRPGQPGTRIRLPLPRDSNASGIDWETTGTFLVTVFDDPTGVSWHYVRCSVVTRDCELAPTSEAP